MRPAAKLARPGSSGESPLAIKSAFTKWTIPAPLTRYSRAKVVLPAPLGPEMTTQRGVRGRIAMASPCVPDPALDRQSAPLRPRAVLHIFPPLSDTFADITDERLDHRSQTGGQAGLSGRGQPSARYRHPLALQRAPDFPARADLQRVRCLRPAALRRVDPARADH